jgi:hypothetical protein
MENLSCTVFEKTAWRTCGNSRSTERVATQSRTFRLTSFRGISTPLMAKRLERCVFTVKRTSFSFGIRRRSDCYSPPSRPANNSRRISLLRIRISHILALGPGKCTNRCAKSSDFGQAKLTKIECVESATCGGRKDGVFGQASSRPRRLIQGGSRMRRRARTDLCGRRSVMIVPTASLDPRSISLR